MKIDSQATNYRAAAGGSDQMVTFTVDGQHFGISALKVRDVLRHQPLTKIPLARPEIAGAINLRGHIVTAIDMRARLGAPPRAKGEGSMCVVVEGAGEWFCLIVDAVGDVVTIPSSEVEPTPTSLPPSWAALSRGIHRAPSHLLLLLDIEQLLNI